MSEIIENEEIEFPLNEEIIIEILDLRYGKKSLIVEALYEDLVFTFNVFWTNKFSSADNKFSFKILWFKIGFYFLVFSLICSYKVQKYFFINFLLNFDFQIRNGTKSCPKL